MLLVFGIVLLLIAIAGGAFIHPVIFAVAIASIIVFFIDRGQP